MKRRVPLMFKDDHTRFTLFPIKNPDMWEMYKKAEASFWTAEEIDLGADNFETLEANEKEYIKQVLAFFAFADGIVVENLAQNFCSDVQLAEARSFYGFQIAIENIHAETYSLLIDTFCKEDKAALFNALKKQDALKDKAAWMLRWLSSDRPFAERLVAFAAIEGIHFSSAFCSIFWLKKRGLPMNGLTFSNELISRDEGLHCDFACLLYSKMVTPGTDILPNDLNAMLKRGDKPHDLPPAVCAIKTGSDEEIRRTMFAAFPDSDEDEVEDAIVDVTASIRCDVPTLKSILSSACEVEFAFIETQALPVRLIGMNAELCKLYVKFVANRLCRCLGDCDLYPNVENPFDWMELLSMQGKTNFFERRVSEYQKAGVMATLQEESRSLQRVFTQDEDF